MPGASGTARDCGMAIGASSLQPDLFGATSPMPPDGLRYELGFLSAAEEAALLGHIASLPLAPMQYRGYTALRRTVSYGGSYDFSAGRLESAEPIADWLLPLRDKAAAWLGVAPPAFTQA
ncbi:MAG: hypothetical protein AVDCRST_MAG51-251, partial [uncultured Ramlibacter sp.]